MDQKKLEEVILETARECYDQGPGWAQESVVLREVGEKLKIGADVRKQQAILTCWHNLFREGRLSWGYDLDTPSSPWFHFPELVEMPA